MSIKLKVLLTNGWYYVHTVGIVVMIDRRMLLGQKDIVILDIFLYIGITIVRSSPLSTLVITEVVHKTKRATEVVQIIYGGFVIRVPILVSSRME